MKNILYKVAAFVCLALTFTSCLDDVLDVESQKADAANVFSDYKLAEYSIFGIAERLASVNAYRGRIHLWYGFNTDIEFYKNTSADNANPDADAGLQLAEYNTRDANGTMNTEDNGYFSIMESIERANICIEGLENYANLNDQDMAYLYGEALTWRAFLYSELVKMWGEVPLRTAPVSNATLYIKKEDRDVIYDMVLKDLEKAIPLLYKPFEKTQTQSAIRVNKAFAAGLYARVAMWATGWAWRPDDGQVGTHNYGSLRLSVNEKFSGDGKKELLHKALTYLEDAMGWGNALESDYEQLWRKFNNSDHLSSSEIIFVMPFSNGRGRWNYTHAGAHNVSEYISGGSRGGDTGPAPSLWWKFGKEDVRRDLTCVPWFYDNASSSAVRGFQLRGRVNYWYWGKYRYEWMFNYPYTGGNDDGIKPIIMRYSDILLMASELAAYEGNLGNARKYLLEVRKRAYAGNESLAEAYVNGLSLGSAQYNDNAATADYNKEGTIMKAIIDERALEFAGEMLRKQDLIRWGLLKIKLDEAAKEEHDLANLEGDFAKYAPYAEDKSNDKLGIIPEYSIWWRVTPNSKYPTAGYKPIEIYGLEADEIGGTPADYSPTEPNGWTKAGFISLQAFYKENKRNPDGLYYRYEVGLYRNPDNNPYYRSVWPHFAFHLMHSQGAIVNDYGY